MKNADLWSGIGLILFSIYGLFETAKIEVMDVHDISSSFYPRVLFIILLFCGIALLSIGWRHRAQQSLPGFRWEKLLPICFLMIGYAVVLEYLGFVIATVIFVAAAMLQLGERQVVKLCAVPLITSLAIFYIFSKVFMISLP